MFEVKNYPPTPRASVLMEDGRRYQFGRVCEWFYALNIFKKIKRYYFNIFLNKKYFKKQL